MFLKQKWFDRKFTFEFSVDLFPHMVERLRCTPARIEERIRDLSVEQFTKRANDSWSIQENIGHLMDLEPLWLGRLDDFMAGAKKLRPADLKNTATHSANHNSKPITEILRSFRELRGSFVSHLDNFNEAEVLISALHPRLQQPMRTLDLAYFVAEHDDHHLARITELLSFLSIG